MKGGICRVGCQRREARRRFGLYIDAMGHCMSFGKRPFHDDSVLLMSILMSDNLFIGAAVTEGI